MRMKDLFLKTCLFSLAFMIAGCNTAGKTGALAGGGIGALAGQAIGRDTESTLIGAAVGTGIGYIIGNEKDKKHAAELSSASAPSTPAHEEVGDLGGTRWRLVGLTPSDVAPPFASKILEFKPDGRLITTTTKPNGDVEVADESYRVVNNTLIVNKPGYLINASYQRSGDQLTMTADKFNATLQRLSS